MITLMVFGPKKLPAAGRSLGEGLREFKDSLTDAPEEPRASGERAAIAADSDHA